MGFLGVFLMSMMLVVASGTYPNPFVSDNEANVAIVYGANAATTDVTAADSIVNSLASGIITEEELERILSGGVTEDEVILGSIITNDGKIRATLTDNQISSLFDGKIEWYDGTDTDSYNVHEEIIIGNLEILTTLDNNDFDGVVLTNNKALEYQYVFDENIFDDYNDLLVDDADALEITILGKDYLIEDATDSSITVTDADEGIFKIGDTFVVDGKTFTVDDIYDDAISVNGVFIGENKKRTINEVQVKVESVYYKDSVTLPSKVKLYYGGEISKEYNSGDAYIGEDDDDPEWVWSIDKPGKAGGHIGVVYDLKQIDEKDDVVYEGEVYTFPHDFVTVSFDGLTDVDYSDYEVFFDEVDLYYAVGTNDCEQIEDDEFSVIVIEGTEDDSFELKGGIETDTIYFELVGDDIVNLYYRDVAEDYSNSKAILYGTDTLTFEYMDDTKEDVEVVYIDEGYSFESFSELTGYTLFYGDEEVLSSSIEDGATNKVWLIDSSLIGPFYANGNFVYTDIDNTSEISDYYKASDTITYTQIDESVVTLIVDETSMDVSIIGDSITFSTDSDSVNDIIISLGEEDDDDDVNKIIDIVSGEDTTSIRNEDNDVMDHYGTIIESPESNMDDDRVVLRVPSEQVYAQVSVFGSEEDSSIDVVKPTPAELNITKVTDGQIPTGKNVIVVGGSCINTMAADLLGGKFCGAEFTTKTGVVAGQVLIETFDRGDGNVVTLVAGFNAEDTVRGVQYLLANNINIVVGEKVII